jgi:type I restriction enzyme S subunit
MNKEDKKDLPVGWAKSYLEDIANIVYGKEVPIKELKQDGYPVFGANGIIGHYDKFLYKDEQVLISCRGAYSGKVNISPKNCFITNNSLIIESDESIVKKKFLYYSLHVISKEELVTGTAQPQVTIFNAKKVPIPLPPLPEQQRIADKIEKLFTRSKKIKTNLDQVPKQLERLRKSILAAAFRGDLTKNWREKNKVSYEWEKTTLTKIGEITGGITLNSKRQLLPLKMPYLRVGNVYSNQIIFDEIKTIGVLEKEISRALLKKQDLLIVEGNGSADQIGRVAQWNGEIENCLHQNHLIKFRSNNKSNGTFVLYFLLSSQGRKQIEEASKSTSGLYTLSLSKVSNLKIPLPPLPEQKEIVRRVEKLLANVDKLEAAYKQYSQKLNTLNQSILAKAFRGELVAQDPNDEPAAVLLERIKSGASV